MLIGAKEINIGSLYFTKYVNGGQQFQMVVQQNSYRQVDLDIFRNFPGKNYTFKQYEQHSRQISFYWMPNK